MALASAIVIGPQGGVWIWVLFSVGCTVVSLSLSLSLSHPAVGLALPAALAGRALSADNLVVFLGVFTAQWAAGLTIDGLRTIGWTPLSALRGGFALLDLCTLLSYVWFLCRAEPLTTLEPHSLA